LLVTINQNGPRYWSHPLIPLAFHGLRQRNAWVAPVAATPACRPWPGFVSSHRGRRRRATVRAVSQRFYSRTWP